MKRKRWGVRFSDEVLIVGTPWFFAVLSCGGPDYLRCSMDWSFSLHWKRDDDAPEGCIPWRHRYRHVLRSKPFLDCV